MILISQKYLYLHPPVKSISTCPFFLSFTFRTLLIPSTVKGLPLRYSLSNPFRSPIQSGKSVRWLPPKYSHPSFFSCCTQVGTADRWLLLILSPLSSFRSPIPPGKSVRWLPSKYSPSSCFSCCTLVHGYSRQLVVVHPQHSQLLQVTNAIRKIC